MAFPASTNPISDSQGRPPMYADLHFTHSASHHPVPHPRRGINYFEIVSQPTTTVAASGHPVPPPRSAASECHPDQTIICDNPAPPPPKPDSSDEEEEHSSSPPPPIPYRIIGSTSSTTTTTTTTSSNITDVDSLEQLSLDLPPLPPRDPFSSEPLSFGLDIPSWEGDTKAFYHEARSAHVDVPSSTIYSQDLDSNRFEVDDSLELGTGGSAYEDAAAIIEAAVMRNRTDNQLRKPLNVLQLPSLDVLEEGSEGKQPSRPESAEYDLPPVIDPPASTAITSSQSLMDNSLSSTYQFPRELDIHPLHYQPSAPLAVEDDASSQHMYDEPPLEMLTFPSHRPGRGSASPRQDDIGRSGHITQQELPPIPSESLRPKHILRSASCDPPMTTHPRQLVDEPPPLPPMNPRGNATATGSKHGANGVQLEPPLPPRNLISRTSPPGQGAVAAPPSTVTSSRPHQHEQLVMEFVSKGFSRTEVVKALAIAQNDAELARKILEGFGRKDQ